MSAKSTAEDQINNSGEPTAKVIPISSARSDVGAVLDESNDSIDIDILKDFLKAIREIDEPLTHEQYVEYRNQADKYMDNYVGEGVLTKDEKGHYNPTKEYKKEGGEIVKTYIIVLRELRALKQSNPHAGSIQTAKPKERAAESIPAVKQPSAAPKAEVTKEVKKAAYPLAIEIDGKTFNNLGEAMAYSNSMKEGAEAFRQRCFGLFTLTVEKINQAIDEAIAQIEKAERIKTKDNKIGIEEILNPFVEKNIVRLDGTYKPHQDIEKASELAKAANDKKKSIIEQLRIRDARNKAYDEVLKSENGFWQTFTDQKGKEVVKFAYQIEVTSIPGTTIKQITVKRVAPKFGNVRLREGSVFVYGDEKNTPKFLNKAAEIIIKEQGQNAQKKGNATLADVMPEKLSGKEKESK